MDSADVNALSKVNSANQLKNQTRQICDKEYIRVSNKLKSNELIDKYFDDVTTLYDGFMRGCRVAGDKPCLGMRPNQQSPYKWHTYNEIKDRATNFGSGLINVAGLRPNNDQLVGIYAKNMVEWVVAEKGLIFYNMVLVPMYNTLGDQAMRYICQQTELELMIVENGKALGEFERDVLKFDEGKGIKKIVLIERSEADNAIVQRCEERGITIYWVWGELYKRNILVFIYKEKGPTSSSAYSASLRCLKIRSALQCYQDSLPSGLIRLDCRPKLS